MFDSIRKLALVVLTLSILLLTFLAILGVWEVVAGDVLEKSLGTMGLLIGSSLLVFFVSLEREKKWIFDPRRSSSKGMGVLKVVGLTVLFFWFAAFLLDLFF